MKTRCDRKRAKAPFPFFTERLLFFTEDSAFFTAQGAFRIRAPFEAHR
jgi:hypothetical protein